MTQHNNTHDLAWLWYLKGFNFIVIVISCFDFNVLWIARMLKLIPISSYNTSLIPGCQPTSKRIMQGNENCLKFVFRFFCWFSKFVVDLLQWPEKWGKNDIHVDDDMLTMMMLHFEASNYFVSWSYNYLTFASAL